MVKQKPDIYRKGMQKFEIPIGLSWLEYCLLHPKEAAAKLQLMHEELVKLQTKED